ncbi:restriction endonuclease subunit S [Providencia rettgeri]|uniref:restriction endonuclease subunit S n=1 Tax=Providencia rettgeri TaxID=587 RepID=UPI001B36E904|nr:restriction endonuclease subunit S [Providencia rettgeri]MBQ0339912.1 restriction endonuclease subunit S [Providencia rettgeri]
MHLGYINESIPPQWVQPLLTDLVSPKQWKTLSTKDLLNEGYVVYGANGKIGFYKEFTHKNPTLMVTCRGASCGNLHISEPYSYISGNAMALDELPVNLVSIEFLKYALTDRGLKDTISGSAQPQITKQGLSEVRISLPSLAEQKSIVDKLNTLLTKVEQTKARLERIPEFLKAFRQSILSAAMSGKLTEEWRYKNTIPSPKEIQLGKIINEGPQNGLYKSQSFYGQGIRIIRIDSFYNGEIVDWNSIKRLSLENSEYSRWKLEVGDILINRVNSIEYLGKSAIVNELPEPAVFESNIMKFRVNPDKAIPEYIVKFLCSTTGLSQLRKNAKLAVNQASINQQDVKNCIVFLPELSEQIEIVRRIEELFAFADSIEQKANAALERVNNLTQSILTKAFRGDLTADWRAANPDLISGENSAESLLEKIKAERKALEAAKKTRTRKNV